MQPQAFQSVVADDFTAVDGIIRQQLKSHVPLVEKIGVAARKLREWDRA